MRTPGDPLLDDDAEITTTTVILSSTSLPQLSSSTTSSLMLNMSSSSLSETEATKPPTIHHNHHHHPPITIQSPNLNASISSNDMIESSSSTTQSSDIPDYTLPELETRYHVQYIKPSKIHVQPLHAADLLYESKKIDSPNYLGSDKLQQYQHITGHFRNKSNKIWDPHPQYEIDAFDMHMHLILDNDNEFIPKDLKVSIFR